MNSIQDSSKRSLLYLGRSRCSVQSGGNSFFVVVLHSLSAVDLFIPCGRRLLLPLDSFFLFVHNILPAHCQTVNFGATAATKEDRVGRSCGGLPAQKADSDSRNLPLKSHGTAAPNGEEGVCLASVRAWSTGGLRMHAILCKKPFVPIREKGHCFPLQGISIGPFPGCKNAAGKLRQKG